MKKHLTTAGCLFGMILQLHAQGYIIPNGVTSLGFNGAGYEIHVIQNPTNADYTGFSLDPMGKTLPTLYTNTYRFTPFVDEGVRTFLVSSNDAISLQPILAGSYTELTFPNNYVFAEGVPFYLGFYTGYNPWDTQGNYTGIYTSPVFGWGAFVNNQGVIQMLGSGLEIEGGGIYAGTQTIIPVPEPSTLGLLTLGGLFLGWRCWRNSTVRCQRRIAFSQASRRVTS